MGTRPRLAAAVLVAFLLVGTSCAGKTVVLEASVEHEPAAPPAGVETDPVPTPGPDQERTEAEGAAPSRASEPSRRSPETQAWWPPAPSPTPSAPESPAPPTETEAAEEQGAELDEPAEEPSAPGPERFTFPQWEEHIYDSRNGDAPEQFRGREFFQSCGDFASEAGAHVISPDSAQCLDEGRGGPGRESAIAVRMGPDQVHVWFVRVGPAGSEYFIDRSQTGGGWVHARCEPTASIGVLSCDEPTSLDGPQPGIEEPGQTPAPEPDEPHTPDEAPEDPITSDDDPEHEGLT